MTGVGAIVFFISIEWIKYFLLHQLAGFTLPAPSGEEIFHGAAGEPRHWLLFFFLVPVGSSPAI